MIVTELSKGIKLYLLVGGRGTRLLSITNGAPKPMVDVNGVPFIQRVIENLSGFDVTLVCSDLNYEYFKDLGVDVFNEGEPSGTAGFLCKVDLPESFLTMTKVRLILLVKYFLLVVSSLIEALGLILSLMPKT